MNLFTCVDVSCSQRVFGIFIIWLSGVLAGALLYHYLRKESPNA